MAQPFRPAGANGVEGISAAEVNHLPISASYARRLGLVERVNRLVAVEMEVEPGVIVLGMVLDTLSGRSPLYHLEASFEPCDRERLLGRVLPAGYFNDDNVGRVLERLYAAGTQKIFSWVSVAALQRFELPTEHVHFDTTSGNLSGDYLSGEGEEVPFKITHGYSKDRRPDLKQFVLSLLCVGTDVPIVGKLEDGNASDKALNHRLLSEVSRHLKAHGVEEQAFITLADSAMVTEANLAQAADRTPFITRLPATYKEHERVINSAIEAGRWTELGRIAQTPATKHRPGASYRVHEDTVTLYGKTYRAVMVHSSAHDKRRQRRLERELAASLKQSQAAAPACESQKFACQADAEAACAERMAQSTAYHQLKLSVQERPRYGRGRPKQDAPRTPVAMTYGLKAEVVEKTEVLAKRRQQAGCFVLLSNVPGEAPGGYSAERILRTDKEQPSIEKNFGFLKEDQIVTAILNVARGWDFAAAATGSVGSS